MRKLAASGGRADAGIEQAHVPGASPRERRGVTVSNIIQSLWLGPSLSTLQIMSINSKWGRVSQTAADVVRPLKASRA